MKERESKVNRQNKIDQEEIHGKRREEYAQMNK